MEEDGKKSPQLGPGSCIDYTFILQTLSYDSVASLFFNISTFYTLSTKLLKNNNLKLQTQVNKNVASL